MKIRKLLKFVDRIYIYLSNIHIYEVTLCNPQIGPASEV